MGLSEVSMEGRLRRYQSFVARHPPPWLSVNRSVQGLYHPILSEGARA